MKKFFSARSPFWQIAIYSLGFGFFALAAYSQEFGDGKVPSGIFGPLLAIALLALAVIYIVLILTYNGKNPGNQIRLWGLLPPELDEQDEIFRHTAFRAIRRVYVYYASVMPLAIIAAFMLPVTRWVVIASLGAILVGHYIVYWVTVWPVWYLEESEQE